MRCKACDVVLTDYEATLKCDITNRYIDLCSYCLRESGERVIGDGFDNNDNTLLNITVNNKLDE